MVNDNPLCIKIVKLGYLHIPVRLLSVTINGVTLYYPLPTRVNVAVMYLGGAIIHVYVRQRSYVKRISKTATKLEDIKIELDKVLKVLVGANEGLEFIGEDKPLDFFIFYNSLDFLPEEFLPD